MSLNGPAKAWTQICDLSENHSLLSWLIQSARNKIGQEKAFRCKGQLVFATGENAENRHTTFNLPKRNYY